MSREKTQMTQVALRVDDGHLEHADALAKKWSRPGLKMTRTDVLRMAIVAGLKELRQPPWHA